MYWNYVFHPHKYLKVKKLDYNHLQTLANDLYTLVLLDALELVKKQSSATTDFCIFEQQSHLKPQNKVMSKLLQACAT